MDLQKLKATKWQSYNQWQEKWYDWELCFKTFNKGTNPLYDLFTDQGINNISLNNIWFYDKASWDKCDQDSIKTLKSQPIEFLTKLTKESQSYLNKVQSIVNNTQKVNEIDIRILSEIKQGLTYCWFIFLTDFGDILQPIISQTLQKYSFSKKQQEKLNNYFLQPHLELGYQKDQKNLQKIASFWIKTYPDQKFSFSKIPHDLRELIKTHTKNYQWLNNMDIDNEPFNAKQYYEILLEMLAKTKTTLPKKAVPLALISKLYKEDRKFLDLVNLHLYLDNLASDLYARLEYLMQSLLSKKFDLSFKDLTWYSFLELEDLVNKGYQLTRDDLKKRKQHRVMIQLNGDFALYYDKKIFNQMTKIVEENKSLLLTEEVKGTIACPGKIQGLVKIVHGVKDVQKVKKGDIIVATTTKPDLMLAIQRCVGIITDSGGITSHAAIVSREYKIPCIVGTKIATQIFQDGDLIELDANIGIVRKL